jgi:hypothetical protein
MKNEAAGVRNSDFAQILSFSEEMINFVRSEIFLLLTVNGLPYTYA